MPRNEMFAAHQGQKRSRGRPLRSLSWMTLMPLRSMAKVEPAPEGGVVLEGADALSVVMTCLPLPR